MVLISPFGSELRELIDMWQSASDANKLQETKNNHIHMLLDAQNLVMFFEFEDQIFGTNEPQRVTYSKMLSPDKEGIKGWIEEANFIAFNLSKAISGAAPAQSIFYYRDVKDIDVISKEKAFQRLLSQSEKEDVQKMGQGAKALMKAMGM